MADMVNTGEQAATFPAYEDLIYEAFIDPIRNITVVDDEYPTLTQFLSAKVSGDELPKDQQKLPNLQRLQKIISLCHTDRNWSVDVFDGKSPELGNNDTVPPHLNHSDLVVLDYHLNGEPTTDNGEKARKIISVLENNNHFNIILVHTKGFGDGDIEQVFNEILCQFASVPDDHNFQVTDEIKEKVEEWLDENNGVEYSFFEKKMSIQDILKHVKFSDSSAVAVRSPKHFLHAFQEELNTVSNLINITCDELVKWFVGDQIERLKKKCDGICQGGLKWSWENEKGQLNYIATGRVFISVIRKRNGEPQDELIEPLKRSLIELNASPMHLLMAKMRHDIDERGLEQANKIVAKREAQAGWLYNLITKSTENSHEHDIVIDAHWEQLNRATKDELRDFSAKLVTAANRKVSGNPLDVVKHFFNECVSDKDKTLGHLNAFNCSHPLLGKHLTTGTVFKAEDEYWVCLTPACDLVPRKRQQWASRIGESHLAFKAVRLQSVAQLSTANKEANTNNYIYLISNSGEPKAFCLSSGKDNPTWDTFFAAKQGIFGEKGIFQLTCLREKQGNDVLESVVLEAEAIAELRYEYALNLLHKFSASQSRVGLGFIDNSAFLQ